MMRILVLVAVVTACAAPAPAPSPDAGGDAETPTFTPCDAGAQCVGSATPHRAAPACVQGQCLRLCEATWADCDGVASNGCEVYTGDGGRCEVVRDVPAVTDVVDVAAEVFADASPDVAPDAGCDASLTNDPANCGACGRTCAAGELCTRGVCVVNTCRAGYAECDRSIGTVCETSLASDPANCGACERRCATGAVCSRGVCRVACVEGDAMCLGRCVDYATDALHCGGCGIRCGPVSVCRAGQCIRQ